MLVRFIRNRGKLNELVRVELVYRLEADKEETRIIKLMYKIVLLMMMTGTKTYHHWS